MSLIVEDCPVCGSKNTDVTNIEMEGDFKVETCYCMTCDADWKRKWIFFENTDIVDNRA